MRSNSSASACIDAWWREPITHGDYNTEFPFLELTNFFGSPHNSAISDGAFKHAGNQAALNVKAYLQKNNVKRIINFGDE